MKLQKKGRISMGIWEIFSTFITLVPAVLILVLFAVKRSRYKNRSNAGALFFEGDCLVLNTGIPYPIPFGEIDRVELSYSPWELENRMSYSLGVTVFRKNGKKKWVYYKGYKTAKLATPQDMEAAMREHGIPCVMVEK